MTAPAAALRLAEPDLASPSLLLPASFFRRCQVEAPPSPVTGLVPHAMREDAREEEGSPQRPPARRQKKEALEAAAVAPAASSSSPAAGAAAAAG